MKSSQTDLPNNDSHVRINFIPGFLLCYQHDDVYNQLTKQKNQQWNQVQHVYVGMNNILLSCFTYRNKDGELGHVQHLHCLLHTEEPAYTHTSTRTMRHAAAIKPSDTNDLRG